MYSRRRAALVLGSALLSPALLQACAKGGPALPAPVPSAGEALMLQHGVLLRILAVYRRAALALRINPAVVDARALADAADLFRAYGEDYHERGLEEALVFPRLAKAGGGLAVMVDVLKQQHERGRVLTGFIHDHCAGKPVAADQAEPVARALESMADMYEAHAAFEDTVVYPAWKKTFTALELKDMGQRIQSLQRKSFKGQEDEAALARLAGIEKRLGVSDVSTYTAPAPSTGPAGG